MGLVRADRDARTGVRGRLNSDAELLFVWTVPPPLPLCEGVEVELDEAKFSVERLIDREVADKELLV